jgi:hypothetical protein
LAILTFAGKDATEEFNMIHPPDVVPKYAPDAIIGVVGEAGAAPAAAAAGGGPVKAKKDKGDFVANHQAWGDHEGENWRISGYDDNPGVLIIPVQAYLCATYHLLMAVVFEVLKTIFANKNFKITNDRVGLTRSAIFLIFFIVVHAVGNLHVFMGPDDFNGYGYFYVRLYWTGFGLPANIVEEYCLLSALLHVFVGLKRTWDLKLKMGVLSGQLNLAMTGVLLLTFMTIHLFQFRFGATETYFVAPPPYLINFMPFYYILTSLSLPHGLNLFWQEDHPRSDFIGVRDIYKLEFDVFNKAEQLPWGSWCGYNIFGDFELACVEVPNFWAGFYIFSVFIFFLHVCMGWAKVLPALGIPKGHHPCVNRIGVAIYLILACLYVSYPLYCVYTERFCGYEWAAQSTDYQSQFSHCGSQ